MFHPESEDILSLPGPDVGAHAVKSQFFTVKQTGQEKEKSFLSTGIALLSRGSLCPKNIVQIK